MLRGNTAAIDFATLRIQWDSHSAMASICSYWSVSKDQLIRLKAVVPLPPRHDRRLRFRPDRTEPDDPTPSQIKAACREIQARWDDNTRRLRAVSKPQEFEVPYVEVPPEAREFFDDINRETQW
jgi:hypothetical protein